MWQQLTALLAALFARFDRVLAYLGGGLLVLEAIFLAMPASETCRIMARVAGLPDAVAPDPKSLLTETNASNPSELKDHPDRWLNLVLEWTRREAGLRDVEEGTCWYYWSDWQRTSILISALPVLVLAGPLASVLSALIYLPLYGLFGRFIARFFLPAGLDKLPELSRKCGIFWNAPYFYLADVDRAFVSLLSNLEILARCLFGGALLHISVSLLAEPGKNTEWEAMAVDAIILVLAFCAIILITTRRIVFYFSRLFAEAIRSDPAPDSSPATGQEHLVDVGTSNGLPKWFDDHPQRWFYELVRRLPVRDSQKEDSGAGGDGPPLRARG